MSEVCFENVRGVVDDIAKESNIIQYHVNAKEVEFAGDNYSSKIVRAQIVEDGGEKRQINLLIKLLNFSQELRDKLKEASDTKINQFEYLAYTRILPALHKFQSDHQVPEDKCFVYPKFFKGGIENMREFMILEDASYDGYVMYDKFKSLDYTHARVILTNLARYHAVSFAMADKDPVQFKTLYEELYQDHRFANILETMAVNVTKSALPKMKDQNKAKAISKFIEGCAKKIEKCFDSKLSAPYNVITHGDFHINNMLFKYEGKTPEVLFVDWQLVRFASPITDIMQITFMSTDKEFRDKYFKQVCDDYYNALGDNLKLYGCDVNKLYPRKVFDQNLADLLPHGLIIGIVGSLILLQKPEEAKDLGKIFDESAPWSETSSDESLRRLDGFADDIMAFEERMSHKN